MVLLLDPYVDAILCLALALLIVGIMESIAPFLQKIPWVGGAIANAARRMAQAISSACGTAVGGITNAVGSSLHAVARFVDHTFHDVKRLGSALAQVAGITGAIAAITHEVLAAAHQLARAWHGIEHGIRTLTKEFHGIDRRVRKLEHELSKGIGHDLRVHIKALEKWEKAAQAELARDAKAITQTIPGELTALKNFIKTLPGTSYLDWVAGIVAAGLAAIGMDWLICRSRNNVNGKTGCALWDDIANLLGVAIVAGLALDLEALIHEAQDVTPGIVDGIEKLAGLKN